MGGVGEGGERKGLPMVGVGVRPPAGGLGSDDRDGE